ncbi:MAG TPA: pectate lyase [Pirellulales bacterium]|jgi:PelA/Pel-15E family pectate lyase
MAFSRILPAIVVPVLVAFCAGAAFAAAPPVQKGGASTAIEKGVGIDVSAFGDSIHHWRKLRDESRFIQPEPDQPSYRRERVREIAANILLFQRANGGWPKDYDMLAVLSPAQREQVTATRNREDTSFDNHNIFGQVEYLARAYTQTADETLRVACLRGFDFMLAAQMPNGGVPQTYPRPSGYHAHITFNDGAMIGVLRVLKDAADGQPHFAWLDAARREKAKDAVRRGIACLLKCQIRVEGQLTGWCQQHDRETYAPTSARTFELASICPQDTTEIVRFLMSIDGSHGGAATGKPNAAQPSPDVVAAIEAAVAWLEKVRLTGVRVQRIAAPREEFLRHTADFDTVVTADPKALPIWARHYEIGTNRPIFAGRDAVKKYELSAIERERRTGTPWYGAWPKRLLDEEYPAWRKTLDR